MTVFRGITGLGKSGRLHSSSLLDLSMSLPLVIELFDEPTQIAVILQYPRGMLAPEHAARGQALANKGG